jgi:CRP-like cAMP-binding protein
MLNADEVTFYHQIFEGLALNDILALAAIAHTKHLRAGETYIQQGSVITKLAFIKVGIIRAYTIQPNGNDVTLMLRWENQFIASLDSIITKKPSRYIYQALEDTILMEVDYHAAQQIIDNNPNLSATRHSFLLQMLAQAMDRIENFVLLSPEERYTKLVAEKPDIINRVADKYISTMLGITPVSLSRIRKRIATSK